MNGLQFNEQAARQLERLYLTSDVVAQRTETVKLLAPRGGERVLDVGCGPGFLCESIAAVVGRDGAVVGIDISSDLITLCKRRNPPTWLSYIVGDATSVDEPDASFDVVACTQVAEYVPDVNRVVSEAFRVLRPGGRAVFVATDWDALVWHSDRPDRMALVMRSWKRTALIPTCLGHSPVGWRAQVSTSMVPPSFQSSICSGMTMPTAKVWPALSETSWVAGTMFRPMTFGTGTRSSHR